jgi:hypothetical protein
MRMLKGIAAGAALAMGLMLGPGTPAVAQTAQTARADTLALSAAGAQAYAKLHDAVTFESARIGFAALESENAKAFRALLAERSAAAAFARLAAEGKPVGRLYGLAGLYLADRAAYDAAAAGFRRDDTQVHTIDGCVMWPRPVREVAAFIASGQIPRELRSGSGGTWIGPVMPASLAAQPAAH